MSKLCVYEGGSGDERTLPRGRATERRTRRCDRGGGEARRRARKTRRASPSCAARAGRGEGAAAVEAVAAGRCHDGPRSLAWLAPTARALVAVSEEVQIKGTSSMRAGHDAGAVAARLGRGQAFGRTVRGVRRRARGDERPSSEQRARRGEAGRGVGVDVGRTDGPACWAVASTRDAGASRVAGTCGEAPRGRSLSGRKAAY